MAVDEKKIQEMVAGAMPQQVLATAPPKKEQIVNSEMEDDEEITDDVNAPKTRVTKRAQNEYQEKFFANVELKDRQMYYIDGELHETLFDILHVLTKRKISVSSYIAKIVSAHIDENTDLINSMYNKKLRKSI